jgi:hypothetical protein
VAGKICDLLQHELKLPLPAQLRTRNAPDCGRFGCPIRGPGANPGATVDILYTSRLGNRTYRSLIQRCVHLVEVGSTLMKGWIYSKNKGARAP